MTRERADLSIVIPFVIFTFIWGTTWIVIRDQLGTVPAQWSITYRFLIAAAAMAAMTRWKGESLGIVKRMFTNGAQDVMEVQGSKTHLLPWVAAIVKDVDLAARRIRVEWGSDW